jgi:hypothetical protein
LLLAVYALHASRNFQELFRVLTWSSARLYINSCLEVGAGTPTVQDFLSINRKAVAGSRSDLSDHEVFKFCDDCRAPPRLCVVMAELPQDIEAPAIDFAVFGECH